MRAAMIFTLAQTPVQAALGQLHGGFGVFTRARELRGAAGAHRGMERCPQMQCHSVTNELKCSISHSRKLKEDYAQRNSILKDTEINVLDFCARILYPYYRLIHTTH